MSECIHEYKACAWPFGVHETEANAVDWKCGKCGEYKTPSSGKQVLRVISSGPNGTVWVSNVLSEPEVK